jgi:2-polyprenyl-3-methyl-5-hydroxy-6-metoxy-1,4-benzoquinol methylase
MSMEINAQEVPADIETASPDYARRFAGPVGEWMLDLQRRIVLDWLTATPGASVLDVGGGHAQLAIPLMNAGFDVTVHGSDESCRARIQQEVDNGRLRFVTGPMLALPFPDRSFDYVVCIRLLPHCARWPDLIRELCRVARRAVIVDYPAWRSVNVFSGLLFNLKKSVEKNTRPFRLFRHGEVSNEFTHAGFKVIGRKSQFFFPMALHRGLSIVGLSKALEAPCRVAGLTWAFGSPTLLKASRATGDVH